MCSTVLESWHFINQLPQQTKSQCCLSLHQAKIHSSLQTNNITQTDFEDKNSEDLCETLKRVLYISFLGLS